MQSTLQIERPTPRRQDANSKLLFAACIISFLAVGIPYWIIPYNQVSLPGTLMGPGILVVIGAAFFVRVKDAIDFWMGMSFVGSVVPGVVMARVIVDCFSDPTAHNLWPFEIVYASFVGFGSSLFGSVVGHIFKVLFRQTLNSRTP